LNNNYTQDRIYVNQRQNYNVGYSSDVIKTDNNQVITFPSKTKSLREAAVKKANTTLCCLLLCAIFISIVSYYFVVSSEIRLNECSRKTTLLNVENAELQNKLDKLKSFNNVDLTMQKSNLLQRPEKVIEAVDVSANAEYSKKDLPNVKPKIWSIGY